MSIVSILILVLIGLIFLYARKKLKKYTDRYNLIQKLPGPKPLPVLGHVFLCLNDDVSLFRKARYYAHKYGPIYAVSMTYFYPTINITGTEELEKIGTTKYSKKSIEYQLLQRWLGRGLLTSKGSQWQTRRKILTPAFHFSILQQFVTIFNQEVDRLIEHLKDEDKKPFCNIVPFISQFTLYSITETSMGTTLDADNEEDKNYITAIHKIGKVLLNRILRPWLFYERLYKLLPVGKLEIELVNCLHSFTDKIIYQREESFEKFEVTENQNYNYSKKKKLALLDLLLNAKISDGIIDNQGIRDEVNTFLFEGHDTTSTSICFTLMLLANHPNYQDLVYKEIISVLGDSKKTPDINDLNELKYMERCIKESLRLYPSVPFIAKCLEEDTTINGYFLPKNAIVHIHIYDIHRNPKYWPDPDKYDPDRFLIDNCVNRHPLSYIPFSAGPRNCIGQRFAILELKAVLCGILREFILLPVDSPETIEMVPDLVLRTKNNTIRVKLCKRHPDND